MCRAAPARTATDRLGGVALASGRAGGRRLPVWVAVALAVLAGLGVSWAVRRQPAAPAAPDPHPIVPAPDRPASGGPTLPVVGNPAPDFTLPSLSGDPVRLVSLKGRPVFINFWATWCPPCLKEMPEIARLHQRYAGRLEVLGVDLAEPRERVEAFVREAGYGWTFLLDSAGHVAEQYLVMGLPTSFFVDPAGIVRARHIGPMTYEQMEAYARQAGLVGPGPDQAPDRGAGRP